MKTVALILGGPSLKKVDVGKIKCDVFVGANWGFLLFPADSRMKFNVCLDLRCMTAIEGSSEYAFATYSDMHGIFVDHAQEKPDLKYTDVVKSTYPDWQLGHPREGLYARSNSGISALNLATIIAGRGGLVKIYGLDLVQTESGKTENFHDRHDPSWKTACSGPYDSMISEWHKAARKIPRVLDIVNCNLDSAVKSFRIPRSSDEVGCEFIQESRDAQS